MTSLSSACPLLLPSSPSKRSYDGYISCGGNDYRICIAAPSSGQLTLARIDCDWKLKHILRGYEGVVQKRLEQSRDLASFLLELRNIMEKVQRSHARFEPPIPPTFYSQLVRDLDILGWDRVVHIDPTFTNLKIKTCDNRYWNSSRFPALVVILLTNCKSLSSRDEGGREHVLFIHLSAQHPSTAPVCEADTPLPFSPQWSPKGSLEDLLRQFEHELERFQVFWACMDDLDGKTWVLEPEKPSRDCTYRRIVIGSNTSLQLTVDPLRPHTLPECQFLGPDHTVGPLREQLNSRLDLWDPKDTVMCNLERLLGISFPAPTATHKEEFSVDCGVCYAYRLEGAVPEIVCENSHCEQPFHRLCLYEWLKGLPTSRQSFNTLFGECPYCTHPISMKGLP